MADYPLNLIGVLVRDAGTGRFSSHSRTPALDAWLIHPDYLATKNFDLEVTYPRPDAEVPSLSYQRKTHPQVKYTIPVCTTGGKPPFKYEIISGPSNATITGVTLRESDPTIDMIKHSLPANYGVINWTNPDGDMDWAIRVTGQDGEFKQINWTTEQDESAFVFIDGVIGIDTNPGTFSERVQSFNGGLWKSSGSDSTFANKIACFADGIYDVYESIEGTDVNISAGVKPLAYVGLNTNTTLNLAEGNFIINTGNVAFINVNIDGARNSNNPKQILINSADSNYLFYKTDFSNNSIGTVGDDNPGSICFSDIDTAQNYINLHSCTLHSSCEAQLLTGSVSNNISIERCVGTGLNIEPSNGNHVINLRKNSKRATMKYCSFSGYVSGELIKFNNQAVDGTNNGDQEIIYNYLNSSPTSDNTALVSFNAGATVYNNATNTYFGRNTIKSGAHGIQGHQIIGGDLTIVDRNIHSTEDSFTLGIGVINLGNNQSVVGTDINSDGELINTAYTNYMGLLGRQLGTPLFITDNTILTDSTDMTKYE